MRVEPEWAASRTRPPSRDEVVREIRNDPNTLAAVVGAATGHLAVTLTTWRLQEMASGNFGIPTTGGIYRVQGPLEGRDSWSVVLKITRCPTDTDDPWDDPAWGAHWHREAAVARNGLLHRVDGVVAPRCFGVDDRRDDESWLWLEDLGAMPDGSWSPADRCVAARALARLHASTTQVPAWLDGVGFVRGTVDFTQSMVDQILRRARRGPAEYAPLDPARVEPRLARLLTVYDDPAPLVALTQQVPRALCHNDFQTDNLVLRTGPDDTAEVVAFDWAICGMGRIGRDLAQLLHDVQPGTHTRDGRSVRDVVLAAYIDEARTADVVIDLATLRRATAASSILVDLGLGFWMLDNQIRDADSPADVADLVAGHAANLSAGHLPDLLHAIG